MLLHLATLGPGRAHFAGRLEFAVLDAAGEPETHRVDVALEVENLGSRIYVHGHVRGTADAHCHRCLAAFARDLDTTFDVVFQRGSGAAAGSEDFVAIDETDMVVDMAPYVREAAILEEPLREVCREDCRGLCAQCGADLNAGDCDCTPPTDPRWDALRERLHLDTGSDAPAGGASDAEA